MIIKNKSIIKILPLLFVLFLIEASKAQKCDAALFMKEGAILDYTDYNKKGKVKSTTRHETIQISTAENNTKDAIIKATIIDSKDKDPINTEYKVNCNNGLFRVDMLRFFSLDKLSEHHKSDLNLQIEGDVLEFPHQMQPGDLLNDGTIKIKVNNQDNTFTLVTLSFDILNRKIVGIEKITTPAGTFECKKVTFDFTSKFGIINVKGTGVEWYYNDAVVIKSESYNRKGKLIGYHQLTSIQ